MPRYFPIKEHLFSEEVGSYISYGIMVRDERNRPIMSVSDVSPNEQFVAGLCDRCNQYRLDPVHLSDVIYDLL